jgi:hypothetical protein
VQFGAAEQTSNDWPRRLSDHWLNAVSFTLDLALGLAIAALVHVILDPPITAEIGEDGKTVLTHVAVTSLQRWILLAAAIALVRLLHSYVILKTHRPLKAALDRISWARLLLSCSLVMKCLIVASLGFSVLVISEPAPWESWAKSILPWLFPVRLTGEELNHAIVSVTVVIPSTAVYFFLLISGLVTRYGLRAFKNSKNPSETLLFWTFSRWVWLDLAGASVFALCIGFYGFACAGAYAAGASAALFHAWLIELERALLVSSLFLSLVDYVMNIRFYGIDLHPPERALEQIPAGVDLPNEHLSPMPVLSPPSALPARTPRSQKASKKGKGPN